MTKREYLRAALAAAGVKKIYGSTKELSHAAGTQYGGVLRASDKPVRAKSRKMYGDQQDRTQVRSIRYTMETTYNVVIADTDEDAAERVLEGFLLHLDKGFDDGNGSWIKVTPTETEWLGEEDNIMKSKVAIQVLILMEYGLYEDTAAEQLPKEADVALG